MTDKERRLWELINEQNGWLFGKQVPSRHTKQLTTHRYQTIKRQIDKGVYTIEWKIQDLENRINREILEKLSTNL
jgi:hypothetical protein